MKFFLISDKWGVLSTEHYFAIMNYLNEEACLNLFGFHPNHRRKGVGTRMIKWLEETALISGNGVVYLETRLTNKESRKFYKSLGYKVIQRIPQYCSEIQDSQFKIA